MPETCTPHAESKVLDSEPRSLDSDSQNHKPATAKWEFDEQVTACFDDMLRRSIPQYEVMRQVTSSVAARFVQPHTYVVDLGSSRGEAVAPLVECFGARNRFCLVECSQPMLQVLRERFAGMIACGVVEVRDLDLRKEYPPVKSSVVNAILTLQFTPIEYRTRIVQQAYDFLVPGGAMVVCEKVLGPSAEIDKLMTDMYYRLKGDNGYSPDVIEAKRVSLEGVLVPLTARQNEEMLLSAGFRRVECIWRWMNFAAWVAIK